MDASHALSSHFMNGALEVAEHEFVPSPLSPIGLRVDVASPYDILRVLPWRAPKILLPNQPLNIQLASPSIFPGAKCVASIARSLAAHLEIQLTFGDNAALATRVSATVQEDGWDVRAVLHPSSWSDSPAITIGSLMLAGRPLLCPGLPATVQVGFRHAPSPAAAVHAAAVAGDVVALDAALMAGGSTEEADEVRGSRSLLPRWTPAPCLFPSVMNSLYSLTVYPSYPSCIHT